MSRSVSLFLVCAIAVGCGSASAPSPLSPSTALTVSPSTGTASVNGSVQTSAGAAGMTVELVGTALRATVGSDNRFALAGIAPGTHRLRFTGMGANAEVTLDSVSAGETLEVIVDVNGAAATVQSGRKLAVNETRFEGRIVSVPPDVAAGTLLVGERTVTTTASTVIRNGSRTIALADLTAATLVEVTGVEGETSFAARLIDVLRDPVLQLDGTVAGLTGTAAEFEFTLGTRTIRGNSATEFKGGGSNPAFARLANGDAVHVAAADKGAFLLATRINLPSEPESTEPPVPVVTAEGTLTAVAGTSPVLTLTVGTSTVVTSASTIVRRKNETLTLAALAVGQTVSAEGIAGTGGAINATRISIEVDPAAPPAPPVTPAAPFDVEGIVSARTGTCPAVTFIVQTKTVVADASTQYVQLTCATLANGATVRVKGRLQEDGSVTADQIKKSK
jgi:hypothetical protein